MPHGPLAALPRRSAPRRRALHAALGAFVAAAAACGGGKSGSDVPQADTAAAAGAPTGGAAVAGDSGSPAVVTKSVPPTEGDRRVAVPDSGQQGDTNRSGMKVGDHAGHGAPKDSQ
jgi:nitrous oxide reductase